MRHIILLCRRSCAFGSGSGMSFSLSRLLCFKVLMAFVLLVSTALGMHRTWKAESGIATRRPSAPRLRTAPWIALAWFRLQSRSEERRRYSARQLIHTASSWRQITEPRRGHAATKKCLRCCKVLELLCSKDRAATVRFSKPIRKARKTFALELES